MKTISKFMCVIILLLLITPKINGEKTEYNLNDRNLFRSQEFAEWLESNLSCASDGVITQNEAILVDEINLSNTENIRDVSGIEIFKNLFSIDVSNSNVETLCCQNLEKLAFLNVSNSKIKELDLKYNKKIYSLSLDDTDINKLDLSSACELNSISLEYSKIKALDISNSNNIFSVNARESELESLFLPKEDCRLTVLDIAGTNIKTLNIYNCNNLIHLDCSSSKLEILDTDNNTSLEYIDLSNTNISELYLNGKINLAYLNLSYTNLFGKLSTQDCKMLSFLNIQNTKINSLDLSENLLIETLIAGKNEILSLDLSNNIQLKTLFICDAKTEILILPHENIEFFAEGSIYADKSVEKNNGENKIQRIKENLSYISNFAYKRNPLCVMHKRFSPTEEYFFKKLSQNLLKIF